MSLAPKNKSLEKTKAKQIHGTDDVALLRFRRDLEFSISRKNLQQPDIQLIKALSQRQFNSIFDKQKNPFFKEIEYIQTCVKHQTGIGEPIHI